MSKSYKPVNEKYISPKGIAFPIGMVIITVTNINPTNWTYGTWEAFGQGRCLVGVDTSQTEFNSVFKTGGEKTHTLTITEMPGHTHIIPSKQTAGNVSSTEGERANAGGTGSWASYNNKTSSNGGGLSHNNLQPYITCYMWKRVS